MKNKRIILIGGGDLCREFLSLLENSNKEFNPENLFYLDEEIKKFTNVDLNPNYLGKLSDFILKNDDIIYLTISNPKQKFNILKNFPELRKNVHTFIHPSCIISKSAIIGKGCILFPYCYISESVTINDFVHLNSYVGVGHDCIISEYTTISAQVDIAGHCFLDTGTFMGSGSRIIPGKKIGEFSSVGAGSVVIKNLKKNINVFGNPAKKIIT
ncbi:hypothetical protein OA957_00360 [Prochlorococcus sp. AH-716-B04]|nr:hypothetical protein [Prochlorococcus sp. AH-716-B04]